MKISIITPTEGREKYLTLLYQWLKAQHYQNWEWLIYDTSLDPLSFQDPKIRYFHSDETLSIGEKRNRLLQKATGEIIVHCDDDDYYAPTYLETVVKGLQEADFFKIHGWFNFHLNTQQIYYWASDHEGPTHFVVDTISGMRTREIEFGPFMATQGPKLMQKGQKGYGFSFAYRQEVARVCSFPDCDLGEDLHFFEAVEKKSFRIFSMPDEKGLVMHVVHDTNTSTAYPQYRVPLFLAKPLFPQFFASLDSYLLA